jgi:hypothetical protein
VADLADRLDALAERSSDAFVRGYFCALLAALDAMGEAPAGREAEAVVALAASAAEGGLRVRRGLVEAGCRPRGDGTPGLRRVVAVR